MSKFALKKADGTAITPKDIKKGDTVTVVLSNGSEHSFTSTIGARTDDQKKDVRDRFESTKASRMAAAAIKNEAHKAARAASRTGHASREEKAAERKAKRDAAMAPRKAARAAKK